MGDRDNFVFGALVAATVLETLHVPGATAITKIAEAAVAKKRREIAEILIEELKGGRHGQIDFEEHDLDPLIDIILRLTKAASEGAAKTNLRLLAQVIAGLKKKKSLEADRFRRWASILEDMTRDELIAVGFAYRLCKRSPAPSPNKPNTFHDDLRNELLSAGYEKEIGALLTAVSRTGLLVAGSAIGTLVYYPTTWLQELGDLADLESLPDQEFD